MQIFVSIRPNYPIFFPLRTCFWLGPVKNLELSLFDTYSMRYFQRALVEFNNLWIHFIFREFNWVSMSKIPSPPLQMKKWVELGAWEVTFFFLLQKKLYIVSILILIYFGIVYIWLMCQNWIRGFDLRLSFYLSKRVSLCSRLYFHLIMSQLELSRIEILKLVRIEKKLSSRLADFGN